MEQPEPKSSGLVLRLSGRASLVHVHNPLPNCDTHEQKDGYYARIRAGGRPPLEYDFPLSKEQYDTLMGQTLANEEACKPIEYGHSRIEVVCSIELTPQRLDLDRQGQMSVCSEKR
jgi:hypothetical protein